MFRFNNGSKFSVLAGFFFSVLVMSFGSLGFSDDLNGEERNVSGKGTQKEGNNAADIETPDQIKQTRQTIINEPKNSRVLEKNELLPNFRFTDNADGTVTDNQTGLCWLKNANCFGPKSSVDAMSIAANLNNGACNLTDGSSRGDWRLPNFGELYDLFHSIRINFAPHEKMDSVRRSGNKVFTGKQAGSYWSSTLRENGDSHAWHVNLNDGMEGFTNRVDTLYVFPVKGHPPKKS